MIHKMKLQESPFQKIREGKKTIELRLYDEKRQKVKVEEKPRNKPAPDGFLMAMEHFSCKPENTIIFEDSPQGIAAAQAAGAQYFVVKEIL